MLAVSVISLISCSKENGGTVASVGLSISDSANSNGKWASGDALVATVTKGGSVVASNVSVSMKDPSSGSMYLTLADLEKTAHDIVVCFSNKVIPEGQNSSTRDFLVGTSTFTPKSASQSLSMAFTPASCKVNVSVRNENQDYSGWNLENVSLTAPSAISGTLSVDGGKAKLVSSEKSTILYEISSPSALRTKAQTVAFRVFPSIGKGSNISISYTLEKDGKRVEIKHDLTSPSATESGGEVTIQETIPATIDGEWSASGSGVKYANVFPGKEWETATPESRGYSSAKLENFRKTLQTSFKTTSLMVAVGGKVIFSYGDVTENVRIASCRKSLLSTLYGKYVENGTIDLSKTLRELGIDEAEDSWGGSLNWDGGSLLESEKDATIQDLLTARSGCFHKPANSGDDHDTMTASDRGKYKHGEYYLYNNWDFNCAGGVFEQLTGKDIYVAFKEDIADPCQWQDYALANQKKTAEYTGASKFPAYHFWISTRDMLRFGHLMLNQGNWDGTQVVSKEWVEKITTIFTPRAQMHPASRLTKQFDYGYLWWLFCKEYTGYDPDIFEGGFTATGSGGQYITVLPKLDMTFAHKDKNQNTSDKETIMKIARYLAACKE